MSEAQGRTRNKQSRRRARGALVAFQKRLRRLCETLSKAEEWYALAEDLDKLLREHAPGMPEGAPERLKQAAQLTEATRQGLNRACRVLQAEVAQRIDLLPAEGLVGAVAGILLAGVLALALAVGAGAAYLQFTAVEVVIQNHDCGPIQLPAGLSLPGVSLPSEPILPGEEKVARAPAISVTVSIDPGGAVDLALPLGFEAPITGPLRAASVTFDGQELVGASTRFDLGSAPTHVLAFTCSG